MAQNYSVASRSYHHVSKRYLPLYLNEFSWRFNNRKNKNMFARNGIDQIGRHLVHVELAGP